MKHIQVTLLDTYHNSSLSVCLSQANAEVAVQDMLKEIAAKLKVLTHSLGTLWYNDHVPD